MEILLFGQGICHLAKSGNPEYHAALVMPNGFGAFPCVIAELNLKTMLVVEQCLFFSRFLTMQHSHIH